MPSHVLLRTTMALSAVLVSFFLVTRGLEFLSPFPGGLTPTWLTLTSLGPDESFVFLLGVVSLTLSSILVVLILLIRRRPTYYLCIGLSVFYFISSLAKMLTPDYWSPPAVWMIDLAVLLLCSWLTYGSVMLLRELSCPRGAG